MFPLHFSGESPPVTCCTHISVCCSVAAGITLQERTRLLNCVWTPTSAVILLLVYQGPKDLMISYAKAVRAAADRRKEGEKGKKESGRHLVQAVHTDRYPQVGEGGLDHQKRSSHPVSGLLLFLGVDTMWHSA